MRSPRTMLVIGVGFMTVAGAGLLAGPSGFPWIPLGGLLLGTGLLVAGLVSGRRATRDASRLAADPDRGDRLVRVAAVAMAVLGCLALIVALTVPEQDAQAHAIGHFLTGLVCAGLFAVLAIPWHPRPGSGTAMVRGIALSLLAAGAIGAFAESLGGSGYDAANAGHRIVALTTLHNLVAPLGAITLAAVPVGVATGLAVLVAWAMRRNRPTPA